MKLPGYECLALTRVASWLQFGLDIPDVGLSLDPGVAFGV